MFLRHELGAMASRPRRRRGRSSLLKASAVIAVCLVLRVLQTLGSLPSFQSSRVKSAKLAFFIQISNSTVLHTPRLLKALHHPKNTYVIHFDTDIPTRDSALIKSLLQDNDDLKNVLIMPSEAVSYAGVTMLLNTLNAIEKLLQVSQDWDFFINLSGADYPLVSPDALRKLFALPPVRAGRLNMLQGQEADRDMAWFYNRRMGKVHVDPALYPPLSAKYAEVLDLGVAHPLSKTTYDDNPFVKSEGWVILHRSFAEYAVHSAQGRRLLLSYATARAPDELFFGTLLNSSSYRTTVAWDAMRYVLWGLHGVRWSRPAFLDEIDADVGAELAASGALFARKFARPESNVLDFIDANISGIHQYRNEIAASEFLYRAKTRLLCIADRRFPGNCPNLQV